MDKTDSTRLARIEGKMDIVLDLLKEDRKRLSAVERKQWYAAGAAAVVGAVVAKTSAFAHIIGFH